MIFLYFSLEFYSVLILWNILQLILCSSLQALDVFNTAVVSPVYYVMFTSFTILASTIMFKVIQNQSFSCLCILSFLLVLHYSSNWFSKYSPPDNRLWYESLLTYISLRKSCMRYDTFVCFGDIRFSKVSQKPSEVSRLIQVFVYQLLAYWTSSDFRLYITFQEWDNQNVSQIVSQLCGFVTILCGTFLLHKTKDMGRPPQPPSPVFQSPTSVIQLNDNLRLDDHGKFWGPGIQEDVVAKEDEQPSLPLCYKEEVGSWKVLMGLKQEGSMFWSNNAHPFL